MYGTSGLPGSDEPGGRGDAPPLLASRFNYSTITPERLVYSSDTLPGLGGGFPASNEFDWFLAPVDHTPADAIVGFGNNTVWDVACRRQANYVVLADHDPNVLRTQEYFYRPLLRISETPADFLSLMAGVPLPEALRNASLGDVFDYLTARRSTIDPAERAAFTQQVEDRVRTSSGPEYAAFVSAHLRWLSNPDRTIDDANDEAPLSGYRYGGKDDFYTFFEARYHPGKLVAAGADPNSVERDPFFCVLSSQESFGWLKNLFQEDRIRFVRADITDPAAHQAIGSWLQESGARASGYAVNNIWDFVSADPLRSTSFAARNMQDVLTRWPTDESFTVYRTRGTAPPHQYENYRLAGAPDIAAELARYDNPVHGLDLRLDAEAALQTIRLHPQPRVETEGGSSVSVRLYFGDALHVYLSQPRWARGDNYVEHAIKDAYFSTVDTSRGRPGEPLVLPDKGERRTLLEAVFLTLNRLRATDAGIESFLAEVGVPSDADQAAMERFFGQATTIAKRVP